MKIDPESLKVVTTQDLIDQGVEPHLASIRVEHLTEKRLKRLDMLDNTIRSGMLHQLAAVMEQVENQSPTKIENLISSAP